MKKGFGWSVLLCFQHSVSHDYNANITQGQWGLIWFLLTQLEKHQSGRRIKKKRDLEIQAGQKSKTRKPGDGPQPANAKHANESQPQTLRLGAAYQKVNGEIRTAWSEQESFICPVMTCYS